MSEEIHIRVNPNLEYDDREAVVVHEPAHVLQSIQGYCRTATRRIQDQVIIPEVVNPELPQHEKLELILIWS